MQGGKGGEISHEEKVEEQLNRACFMGPLQDRDVRVFHLWCGVLGARRRDRMSVVSIIFVRLTMTVVVYVANMVHVLLCS